MTTRMLILAAPGERSASLIRSTWQRADRLGARLELHIGSPVPCLDALLYVARDRRVHLPSLRDSGFAQHVYEACLERVIDVVLPTDVELLEPLEAEREAFEHAGIRVLLPPADPSLLRVDLDRVRPPVSGWRAVPEVVAHSLQEMVDSLRPRRLLALD